MRRYALISLLLVLFSANPAFAQNDDDSATAVESGDDDSASVPAVESDTAPVEEAEVTAEEAAEAAEDVVEAVQTGNWVLGAAGLFTLFIFIYRRFFRKKKD